MTKRYVLTFPVEASCMAVVRACVIGWDPYGMTKRFVPAFPVEVSCMIVVRACIIDWDPCRMTKQRVLSHGLWCKYQQ
jgi:hypothetical protein